MAAIRLDGVRKQFGADAVAVDDLSIEFAEGSTTCLLGPSGCGKTTLMRMIAGLETPTSGRIFFDDVDVTTTKTRDRDLGMVFQYPVVYRGTTVRENVALPLKHESMTPAQRAERVDEVLSMLGLEPVAETDVSKLDNASRQKVAVARSISRRPSIVLFDEPITNVDIHAKLQLKRVLKELFTRLNQTVLYVTHDQTEAMTLADNIALMRDGRIEQLAPPRRLYSESASVFAGWFLGNPGMNFVHRSDAALLVSALLGSEPPDDVATVGFRPEDVSVASTGVAGMAGVEAVLEHVAISAGGQRLITLRAHEQSLKAKIAHHAGQSLRPGDRVFVSISHERIAGFDAGGSRVSIGR